MLGNTSNSVLSDRVYDLIQELNIIQPTILLSVLPQLEFKLKVCLLPHASSLVMLDGCTMHISVLTGIYSSAVLSVICSISLLFQQCFETRVLICNSLQ